MSFNSFNLHPQIAAGVKALGYQTPTPIQRQAIPPSCRNDVMGLAQTGTGKTAAFVLPILERLMKSRVAAYAPLLSRRRELAEQINTAVADLGRGRLCEASRFTALP
jgi:ATP-dependent RNA helicase RhlE